MSKHKSEAAPSVVVPIKESSAVIRVRGLGDLMVRRPELSGVHRIADVASEAIRWSA